MTVAFMRNKMVEVEPSAEDMVAVHWRLTDDLTDVEMKFVFQLPDLEITEAQANVKRSLYREGVDAPAAVSKVIGVRVGPGLRKIVRGLMGGSTGSIDLTEGVLDCCNAVILHFTLPGIQAGEQYRDITDEERINFMREMVKGNPRLPRSCIAFADDSPIMAGLNL